MIPKHLLEPGGTVTHELLEYVAAHPGEFEGKYEPETRTAAFIYIGEGVDKVYAGFRLSKNFIDECDFNAVLWWITERNEQTRPIV